MTITIAPSLLSADLGAISSEIQKVVQAGMSWVHLDVMDGRFVPNITFGPEVIRCLEKPKGAIFDAHLMIQDPDSHIDAFAKAGVDYISVHAETTHHLHRTLQHIKDLGCKASVALNPATPIDVLDWVYDEIDMVLLMSVNPGWGGQSFIPSVLQKIEILQKRLQERNLQIPIQVDGGVNLETIQRIVSAGASNLVVGSAMFSQASSVEDYHERFNKLSIQAFSIN